MTPRTPDRIRRALLPALAVLAVLAATAAGGETSSTAADDRPIRVLRSTYTIDYGRQIEFSLEATSEAAVISEIRAFYTPLGPGGISLYSYLEFQPDRTVRASFAIPTAGSSFFPPGTRFDVDYLISDALGNELRTERIRLEYLDPQFEWRQQTTGAVTVVYHDRNAAEIDRILEAAAARLPLIEETLGIKAEGPYRGVLVNSRREADLAFPFVSTASRSPHAFSGFAFGRYGVFVLWGGDPRSFIHELSHMLFADAVSSPLARTPSWLNEGLSVYFETGSSEATRERLNSAARRGDLAPIRLMNTVPGDLSRVAAFYAKSGDFVAHLIETFGAARMSELLARIDRGTRLADAVQTVYGLSLDLLDRQWEAQFYGEPAPQPGPGSAPADTASDEIHREPGPTRQPTGRATPVSPQPTQVPAPTADPVTNPGRETRGLVLGGALALLALAFAVSFVRRKMRRTAG